MYYDDTSDLLAKIEAEEWPNGVQRWEVQRVANQDGDASIQVWAYMDDPLADSNANWGIRRRLLDLLLPEIGSEMGWVYVSFRGADEEVPEPEG
jgi:hypothetical protein